MEKVLIAGCGRIGSTLGLKLAESGFEVHAINRSGKTPAPIKCIQADLAKGEYLHEPYDYVVYTASAQDYSAQAYQAAYVDGLRHLISQLQAPPKRLLYTSSTAVYGQSHGEWVDEFSPTEPVGFAGRLLLEGERLLEGAPFDTTVVRFSGIYGPEHNRFLEQVSCGEVTLSTVNHFTNRIHSEDCARLFEFLINERDPEPLYLGTDSCPVEKNTLIHWLEDRLGLPRSEATNHLISKRGNKRCSNERLLATGFELKFPSFREGYDTIITAQASI